MEITTILLLICIFVVLFFIFAHLTTNILAKPIILYALSNFDKGNFIIVDTSNNELVKVINNQTNPIPIVKVLNQPNFFNAIYNKSELGLGESYMNGDWVTNDLVEFLNTICLNQSNPNVPKVDKT